MKYIFILAICAVFLSSCSPVPEETTSPEETVLSISLEDTEPYTPWVSMEPDTVPAEELEWVLSLDTLPDGRSLLCYQPAEDSALKYWAIRDGDQLLRFCREDACYTTGYSSGSFTDILGHDGFFITAQRGLSYLARDYYIFDDTGTPRLLAGCSGEPLETDVDGDGERELLWFYHAGMEVYYFYHKEGVLYEANIPELMREQHPDWLIVTTYPENYADGRLLLTAAEGGWDALPDKTTHHEGWMEFTPEGVEVHLE